MCQSDFQPVGQTPHKRSQDGFKGVTKWLMIDIFLSNAVKFNLCGFLLKS